ncbi:tetraspanin 34a [Genypterus blacodes]|uniref:tetraspanin 34a n=1 Tax=Genypterus blacodes TaxID=154954 RepID=UPI003F761754
MCCSGFLKIMMFVFNGAIFLAGVSILGVGVWVKVDSGSLLGFINDVEGAPSGLSQLANLAYLLIGVGAVLLIIGFLGCCGAIRESRCMLLTFFSIVLIIFIIQIAGAVVLFVFEGFAEELLTDLHEEVRKNIQTHYGLDEKLTELWNGTMEEFKCCGFMNYTDFDDSPFLTSSGGHYPSTCCNSTMETCTESEAMALDVEGCFVTLLQLIEENATIVASVALGVAALEIAAMVVSMVLYKDIGNK